MAENWEAALDVLLPMETLRLILQLAYEFEELTGQRMTAQQLRAALRKPGA